MIKNDGRDRPGGRVMDGTNRRERVRVVSKGKVVNSKGERSPDPSTSQETALFGASTHTLLTDLTICGVDSSTTLLCGCSDRK